MTFGDPATLGRVPLAETSGLAVGARGLYAHEDSGSGPVVVRLDRTGRVLARTRLRATARDWEDMAAAPDAQGRPCLWFADTGDNRSVRPEVQVHRVPEDALTGPVTTYRFRYADGPHDAEALLVLGGRVVVVTKQVTGAGVYAADGEVLRRVADLVLRPTGTRGGPAGVFGSVLVTGGSVAPGGERLALRTYTDLYEWPVVAGDPAATFAQRPDRSPLPPTEQGEAVAYDGPDAVLVTSEGAGAPLQRLVRQAPAAAPTPTPTPAPTPASTATAAPVPLPRPPRWPVPVPLVVAVVLAGALVLARRARG